MEFVVRLGVGMWQRSGMKRREVDGFPSPLFDGAAIELLLITSGHCRRQGGVILRGWGYKRTEETVRKEGGGRVGKSW